MRKLRLDADKCVGCKICELNCSFAHYNMCSHDIANMHIMTVEETADFAPHACIQCEARRCVEVCPTDAINVDGKTGAIKIDQDLCVFCRCCVTACKYKGIRVVKLEGMEKIACCDLCGGKEPACAAACREGAITLEYGKK